MVACDRQQHVTDAVLEHVSNDKLFTQLADQLNVTLKELVTFKQSTLITVSSNVVSMVFSQVWQQKFIALSGLETIFKDTYLLRRAFVRSGGISLV